MLQENTGGYNTSWCTEKRRRISSLNIEQTKKKEKRKVRGKRKKKNKTRG